MTLVDTWFRGGDVMRGEVCHLLLWTSLAVMPVCAEPLVPGELPGEEWGCHDLGYNAQHFEVAPSIQSGSLYSLLWAS